MKHNKGITELLMLFTVALMGCVATTPKQPPQGVELVMFKAPVLGTQAEWELINFSGKKSTKKSAFSKKEFDGKVGYYWANPTSKRNTIYDLKAMNWLGRWSYEDNSWIKTARPSNQRLQYPLWPGKSYKAKYSYWEKGGWSGKVFTDVNISDWENTTVRAGTFRTLKIIQKNQHFTAEVWFAPKLGSNVKYKYKNKNGIRSGELISIANP